MNNQINNNIAISPSLRSSPQELTRSTPIDRSKIIDNNIPALASVNSNDTITQREIVSLSTEKIKNGIKLHLAVANNNIEEAKMILQEGNVDTDYRLHGITPLMKAVVLVSHFNPGMIKLLLDYGADIDARTQDGHNLNVLLAIAHSWHAGNLPLSSFIEKLSFLIDIGADINSQDAKKYNLLIMAMDKKCPDLVAHLLEKNADVNIVPEDLSSLMLAAMHQSLGHFFPTILDRASREMIDLQDDHGRTALMILASNGDLENLEILLSKYPQLDLQDEHGLTALTYAIFKDNLSIVKTLLDAGASKDILDREGNTPLMHALVRKNNAIAQYLIEQSCVLNHQNNIGDTTLLIAARHELHILIDLLIECGADINITSKNWSLLMYIVLHSSLHGLFTKILELCSEGMINFKNAMNNTALMIACQEGYLEIVDKLLNHGAIPNIQNCDGTTALHMACISNNGSIVKKLLAYNADWKIADDHGFNALDIAILSNKIYSAKIIANHANIKYDEELAKMGVSIQKTSPTKRRGRVDKKASEERYLEAMRAHLLEQEREKINAENERIRLLQERERQVLVRQQREPVEEPVVETGIALRMATGASNAKKESMELHKAAAARGAARGRKKATRAAKKMTEHQACQLQKAMATQPVKQEKINDYRFFLRKNTYKIYEKLFSEKPEITWRELLTLLGDFTQDSSQNRYESDNASSSTQGGHGSHLRITLKPNDLNPKAAKTSQTFVMVMTHDILPEYNYKEAREKLIALGFGPEYVLQASNEDTSDTTCTTTSSSS